MLRLIREKDFLFTAESTQTNTTDNSLSKESESGEILSLVADENNSVVAAQLPKPSIKKVKAETPNPATSSTKGFVPEE